MSAWCNFFCLLIWRWKTNTSLDNLFLLNSQGTLNVYTSESKCYSFCYWGKKKLRQYWGNAPAVFFLARWVIQTSDISLSAFPLSNKRFPPRKLHVNPMSNQDWYFASLSYSFCIIVFSYLYMTRRQWSTESNLAMEHYFEEKMNKIQNI